MKPQRALICSYAVPTPDRDSGSQRLMDFIDFLREAGWRVEFLATTSTEGVPSRSLRQRGIPVHSTEALTELAQQGEFDLVLAAFWPVAELVMPTFRRFSPTTHVIVDSVDLHYLRNARRVFGGVSQHGSEELLNEAFGAQVVGELNTYAAADMVLAVSQKESETLHDILGERTPTAWVPDCEELPMSSLTWEQRRGILSVGSFAHLPNVDAVEFLCREVLPLVDADLLAEHPVYIVGNGLDERISRLADDLPSVRMVGWVPSLAEYYARTRIAVVPLRYGAGTKRKMVQALMSGTPTVATTIGTEGLGLVDGEHVLAADTPEHFAAAIECLLTNQPLWSQLAEHGRAHLLATHSRDVARKCFLNAVAEVIQRSPKAYMLADAGMARYHQRVAYQNDQRASDQIRAIIRELTPEDAKIVVAGIGDSSARMIHGHPVFPLWERTELAHESPIVRGRDVAKRLDQERANGARYFILAETHSWWLDHFGDVRGYLEARCRQLPQFEQHRVYDLAYLPKRVSSLPDSQCGNPLFAEPRDADFSPHECSDDPAVKLIAFYLPQYHPIPENDRWWGEGFTEWTNVTKAKPLFPNHHQPRLPTDLGYYDLRLAETRREQADLARQYGIHGFCYYHYWFQGKMLLERPFNEVLQTGEPDFPFCLCWANEPWSRRWDGRPTDVLQPQAYSLEDDLAHIRWLLPALADPRAIRVGGKSLMLIYQGRELPSPERTVEIWRREVDRAGLGDIHLVAVETGWDAGWDATQVGFDAKVLFQPQFSLLGTVPQIPTEHSKLRVFDYERAWPILANPDPVPYLRYDSVFPNWDNTARRGTEGWVLHNASPAAYEQWLQVALERALERPADQRLLFLNAWNEWGEGCHLEPERRHGLGYLEATRRALAAVADRFALT